MWTVKKTENVLLSIRLNEQTHVAAAPFAEKEKNETEFCPKRKKCTTNGKWQIQIIRVLIASNVDY